MRTPESDAVGRLNVPFITPADIWQSSGQAFGSRHEEAPGEDRGFIAEEDFPGIVHVRCGDLLL